MNDNQSPEPGGHTEKDLSFLRCRVLVIIEYLGEVILETWRPRQNRLVLLSVHGILPGSQSILRCSYNYNIIIFWSKRNQTGNVLYFSPF